MSLAGLATATMAQVNPLTTTAGLKAACQTRPGNLVTIDSSITVNQGYPAGYPEQVATGCTIQLINGATIQFDKVGMAFAGPLVIGGASKTSLSMQEATLAAPTVALNFGANNMEASISMLASRIDATVGALNITLPSTSKMEVSGYRTGGVPLTNATLVAAGALNITAGAKLSASVIEAGLVSGGNLNLTSSGHDIALKLENSAVLSFNGQVAMRLHASNSKFEFSNSSLSAPRSNVRLTTAFHATTIGLSNVAIAAGGNVHVHGEGTSGNVEVSNGSMVAGGSLFVAAAAQLGNSGLKIDGGTFRAATPIRFVTGAGGKTGVYGSAITGTGHVQVATGAGGACEALNLRIASVTQSLCQ